MQVCYQEYVAPLGAQSCDLIVFHRVSGTSLHRDHHYRCWETPGSIPDGLSRPRRFPLAFIRLRLSSGIWTSPRPLFWKDHLACRTPQPGAPDGQEGRVGGDMEGAGPWYRWRRRAELAREGEDPEITLGKFDVARFICLPSYHSCHHHFGMGHVRTRGGLGRTWECHRRNDWRVDYSERGCISYLNEISSQFVNQRGTFLNLHR